MEEALVKIVKDNGLDEVHSQALMEKFSEYFQIASEWDKKAKEIVVTSEAQIDDMKKARDGRLFLMHKCADIEKIRKQLKDGSLREGRAIDDAAKAVRGLIEPIRDYLELQEKFIELREKAMKTTREKERMSELSQYGYTPGTILADLYEMSDEAYNVFKSGVILQYEKIQEEKRLAEEERIRKASIEALNAARKKESLLLHAFITDWEFREFGELSDEEWKAIMEEAATKKHEHEANVERIRKENEELRLQAEEDRKERQRLQDALEETARQEAAEITRKEQEEASRIKAEKKAAAAPDKVKLELMISNAELPSLSLKTEEAIILEKAIREKFDGFKAWSKKLIETL